MTAIKAKDNWLPNLLREWAEWYREIQAAGFSDATPIWRAYHEPGGGGFGPRIPVGVTSYFMRGAMKQLIRAMDALIRDNDVAEPILVTQTFYLFGMEKTREAIGKSRAQLYNTIRQGELLIKREMNRR